MKSLILILTLLLSIPSFSKASSSKKDIWTEIHHKNKKSWEEKTEKQRPLAEINLNTDASLAPYRVTSKAPHEMKILNSGIASFYARIDMIRRAKKTLEVEYFIFNPDISGRILLRELINASQRGVKVRILLDGSFTVLALNKYYAKKLQKYGIETRYYNNAPFYKLSSIQFRNHRKFIIMDDQEIITGGRNIGDEYFDLSEKFNFLDRDIWVKGEIISAVKESFNRYWNDPLVVRPKEVIAPIKSKHKDFLVYGIELRKHQHNVERSESILKKTEKDTRILNFTMTRGKEIYNSLQNGTCKEVAFATDKEGASFKERLKPKQYKKEYRLLRKEISKWFTRVKDEVIIESPYFLNNKESKFVLDTLLSHNIEVKILTNSLASTDAILVATLFNEEVKLYTQHDYFTAYIYKGDFSKESSAYKKTIEDSVWGVHSKTIIFNDNSFMVGTFNIDNRSSFYNTETAIFCAGSTQLTNDIRRSIEDRMAESYRLGKDGKPDDGSPILSGASTLNKFLYFFLRIPAAIFKFLL